MSKDQTFGVIIFIACLIVAVGYVTMVAAPRSVKAILPWFPLSVEQIQFGAIATAVFAAFPAIMFIGAWIGWTMATTPPPEPMEELKTETSENNKSEKEA